MNAISFDWSKNWNNETCEFKLENIGRNLLEQSCKHYTRGQGRDGDNNVIYSGYCEECGISEDSSTPMMNYIYPLNLNSYDDNAILKVCNETNLTVVKDTETEEMFLTLCGGGMDLSQDIAKAYLILENRIPVDLLKDMCLQPELSISLKDFIKVTRQAKKDIKNEIRTLQHRLKYVKIANREARIKAKNKRDEKKVRT